MIDIPKQYEPRDVQTKWFAFWEQHGYFNADAGTGKPTHTIMIPLPNVTGALHMGHALNSTCQDLINRWRRMQGYEALWMPGTDHAGIATQAVVERRMFEQEGLTRHDIGREALVERIWNWKDTYEKRILSQLKSVGDSCDWRRTRFTLDPVCARAVRRTFFNMFKDGLIYRGKRLVNWDVHLQTAVADDEVFEEEIDGHFWTFNYPVVDDNGKDTSEVIRFSTTRPETMLGDTAVCVHPTDERYAHLVGKQVRIPVSSRAIPIIADALLADKELGTGAVKVTPGHDPNDHACYTRNPHIGVIDIMNPDGTLTDAHGEDWKGLDRLAARPLIVQRMQELGRFEGVEDRKIPMKHSDRSKTPIEPLRSDQWWVRMTDNDDGTPGLAQKAVDAVQDGRVRFYPSRYAKTYIDWLGEKRDWCISRQLWWGHRIPVWTFHVSTSSNLTDAQSVARHEEGHAAFLELLNKCGVSVSEVEIVEGGTAGEFKYHICAGSERAASLLSAIEAMWKEIYTLDCEYDENTPIKLAGQIKLQGFPEHSIVATTLLRKWILWEQDPDVLDTWFSSALWPHATLGWPDREQNPPLDEAEVAKQTAVSGQRSAASRETNSSTLNSQLSTPPTSTLNSQRSTNAVLNEFYPHEPAETNKSVLITSRDIITLWVARMVLTGLYNMGDIPFRHVHVHPKILDGFGQTMSKSKGNGVDPVDLIDKYGTDAVRFTIASFAGETQDVKLPISYECPVCQTLIPQTLKHQSAKPTPGKDGQLQKPTISCPKCKKNYQYTSPNYEPDAGQPVARMVSERFEYGRNFCNKFWNAARFAMLNLQDYTPGTVTADQLQLEDRWILSRLSTVANQMTEYLGRYQFDAATRAVRDFTWNEFCDWYLEMVKPRLRRAASDQQSAASEEEGQTSALSTFNLQPSTSDETRATAQRVLLCVLDSLVRLLQPFTPFICEELWKRLNEIAPERAVGDVEDSGFGIQDSVKVHAPSRSTLNPQPSTSPSTLNLKPSTAAPAAIVAPWPVIPRGWQDAALEKRFERLQETIVAVRNVRAIYNIPPGTPVKLLMRASADVAGDMQSVAAQFDNLTKAVLEAAGAEVQRPSGAASFSLQDADGYIPLSGLIDTAAEKKRQEKEAETLRKHIAGHEAKLNNEAFTSKAPENIIAQVRETLDGMKKQLASVEEILRDLG